MALIILIAGTLTREHDLLNLERVAMGPYGHSIYGMAEGVSCTSDHLNTREVL